jgi:hypothetical protein
MITRDRVYNTKSSSFKRVLDWTIVGETGDLASAWNSYTFNREIPRSSNCSLQGGENEISAKNKHDEE